MSDTRIDSFNRILTGVAKAMGDLVVAGVDPRLVGPALLNVASAFANELGYDDDMFADKVSGITYEEASAHKKDVQAEVASAFQTLEGPIATDDVRCITLIIHQVIRDEDLRTATFPITWLAAKFAMANGLSRAEFIETSRERIALIRAGEQVPCTFPRPGRARLRLV